MRSTMIRFGRFLVFDRLFFDGREIFA